MITTWFCAWCDYPNESNGNVCTLCNERTEVHNSVMRNDRSRIADTKPRVARNEDIKRSPEFKPRTIPHEPPKQSKAPETKESNPPTPISQVTTPADTSDEHICCRDTNSIICLICQKPMFFSFANKYKYPADFPTVIFDKVAVLDNIFTEDVYKAIVNELNGKSFMYAAQDHAIYVDGELISSFVEIKNPMHMDFTINAERTIYMGPNARCLKNIFAQVVQEKRPAVLTVLIENDQIGDREEHFLAIYPSGHARLINASLSPCTYEHIEDFLVKLCSDDVSGSDKCTFQFVRQAIWHRTCIRQSKTYIDFTLSPMWRPIMHLMLMSMTSLGYAINTAIAFLVVQDKQEMVLLLDVIVERLVAFALSFK